MARGACGLQCVFWNDPLRTITRKNIRAKAAVSLWAEVRFSFAQKEGRASVIVPDFDGFNAVSVACQARFQQKVDAGSSWVTIRGRVDTCLAIKSTLEMARAVQGVDDVLCCHGCTL